MKIFCIGRNYADHAKELNNPVPESPVVFMKPPTALLLDNKPFYYPEFSQDVHHEVEIVLKISRNGKAIEEAFAQRYYEEVALGIDFTARDLQNQLKAKGQPWELAKAFDRSAVLSPFVPHVPSEAGIDFSLRKNGELVQAGNTRDMLFSFERIVSFLSRYFTLQKGDLIFTGTPAGVGPVRIGDELEGFLGEQAMFRFPVK